MRNTKKKVSKIVDEILNYLFYIGGTEFDIKITEEDEYFKMQFKSDFKIENRGKLEEIRKYFDIERNEQMDSYYWELAGETDINKELSLIGMMVDQYLLDVNDNKLILTLIRNKDSK